jgi:PAS domain S-box-containing protein
MRWLFTIKNNANNKYLVKLITPLIYMMKYFFKTIEFRILAACLLLFISLVCLLATFSEIVTNRTILNILIGVIVLSILLVFFIALHTRIFFGKDLYKLIESVKHVSDHHFSRKYKLTPLTSKNEIGVLSREVSLMLEKLHERTTQMLAKNEEIEQAHNNTRQLVELGKNITTCLSINDIIRVSFESIHSLFEASFLSAGLYNKERKGLDMFGIRGGDDNKIYLQFEDMTDKNRWSVYCYETQQDISCSEYDPNSKNYFSNLMFRDPNNIRESFIYIPLTLRNELIGVLSVQSLKKNAYSEYHLNIIKNLAVYIAIALVNAEAFTRIEKQKNALEILTSELENARNHLEEQVIERTSEISQQKKEIEDQNAELAAQRESILQQSHRLEKINVELERLSLVARKTENAIMIMDASGNILWINECLSRINNCTYSEFIKNRGSNVLQTSFNPNIKEDLQKVITTKKAIHYDALNIKSGRENIWTRTTLTPVLDDKGDITHLLTIDSDITLLKEAQDKIEKQSLDITDSIHSAFRIQEAVLSPIEKMKEVCADHFIYYKPCDIVSGDFYWWHRKGHKFIIAVADCTGHGVSGALMSMLGISFLNEIVKSDILDSSGNMLNRLRRRVKSVLKQTGKTNELSDGMDIALCIIDTKTSKLCFSGAYNSLLLYRNGTVLKYKGDRMPIGIYQRDDEMFTDQEIALEKEDRLYLYTDGIPDQFGGPSDRKFSHERLYDIIAQHGSLPMAEQKIIYDKALKTWMGKSNTQIDDICLIGFRLT